ncbi:MAG: MepB family protein, partial [Anaerolineae bacterium]
MRENSERRFYVKARNRKKNLMDIEIDRDHLLKTIHSDLLLAEQLVYKPIGFIIQHLKAEDESADYGAAEFTIDSWRIKFRVGKITPTKNGQFITFWKRLGKGPILPYEYNDPFDLLIVSVRAESHFGQFVFPKTTLLEKGVVSKEGKGGKRAMRIYPPWDIPDSRQAKSTQAWQLPYFFEIFPNTCIDISHVKKLFLYKRKT